MPRKPMRIAPKAGDDIMTLAVPVWEGRISPVFDVARHLLLVEVEDGLESSREERTVSDPTPYRWGPMLAEMGVDSLICGAISDEVSCALARHGVQIIPWIRGEVDDVTSAFLSGELRHPRFMMPGATPKPPL
jgi:predicted Fe-Mo cluster-binding NifX family protein